MSNLEQQEVTIIESNPATVAITGSTRLHQLPNDKKRVIVQGLTSDCQGKYRRVSHNVVTMETSAIGWPP